MKLKKNIKSIALLAVLSIAAVGCQKETIVESEMHLQQPSAIRNVTYAIDGVTMYTVIQGEQNWHDFVDWMLTLAEQGHRVCFHYTGENSYCMPQSKEVVVHKTPDKDDAIAWALEMTGAGYEVSIEFDSTTGVYTCTATRPDNPGSQSDTTGVL